MSQFKLTVSSGSATDMSSANVIWAGAPGSRGVYQSGVINIGFTFSLDGTTYTQFQVYTSGVVSLGNGTLSNFWSDNLNGANIPVLAPFWDYMMLDGGAQPYNGCTQIPQCSYRVTGAAGSRVLTVEWANWETAQYGHCRGTWQVRMYETTGKVEFCYPNLTSTTTCPYSSDYTTAASIGLANGTGGFMSVTPTGSGAATTSVASANGNVDIYQYQTGGNPITPGTLYTFNYFPNVQLSTTPKSLDFGTISAGSTAQYCVAVKHAGTGGSLTFNSATISGSGASAYSIVSSPPGPLSVGQSSQYCIQFAPMTNGTLTAVLTIVTNGLDSGTQSISLTGVAVAPTILISPIGTINTATKMFRQTRTSIGSSLSQSFLVTNTGAGSLIIGPASFFTGSYPGDYTFTRFPSNPITTGNSDTVTIRFTPTGEGGRPAVANILSNAANGPQLIDLFGNGIIPRIEITPSEMMTFDSIPMGATVCKNVVIYNRGSDSLRITKNYFSSNDGDFSFNQLTTHTETTIAPLDSRTLQVCFTPLQKGTRRARIRILTTIPPTFGQPSRDTSWVAIDIWANAVPSDLSRIAMKDFSDVILGDDAVTSATVTNDGSEPITLDQPTFSGANAKEFTIKQNLFPMTIAPGKTANFDVIAAPVIRGVHTATINVAVTNTDGNTSVLTAPLTIKALLACSEALAQSVIFEKIFLGENTTKSVEVSNCGDITQTFTATLASTTDLSIQGASTSGIVAPGEKAVFSVHFDPQTEGQFTGTLSITGDHIEPMSIPVSGTSEKKPVAQSVGESVEANGYVLSQNHPNPASGRTHFSFTAPNDGAVHIVLADITGKVVKELANSNYTAGMHTIEFKTNDLSSGTYIYLLEAGGTRLIRQMVVSR